METTQHTVVHFSLDKTDLQIHLPHRDIPRKSLALDILVQVKRCDLMISQLEATYFENVTFQYETDKVVRKNLGDDKKSQAFFALHLANIATEIRSSSKGAIWQRRSRKWLLPGGNCSFLSPWFSLWKCTFTPLVAACRFSMTKVLLIPYGLSWVINKRNWCVCVCSRHTEIQGKQLCCVIHDQKLSHGHFAGCITCNFLDGAKDIETFRVHGSNTMIHIPARHTHRKKSYCLYLS